MLTLISASSLFAYINLKGLEKLMHF